MCYCCCFIVTFRDFNSHTLLHTRTKKKTGNYSQKCKTKTEYEGKTVKQLNKRNVQITKKSKEKYRKIIQNTYKKTNTHKMIIIADVVAVVIVVAAF